MRPHGHAAGRGPLLGRHRRRGGPPRPRLDAPQPARATAPSHLDGPHRRRVLPGRVGAAGARPRRRRVSEDDLSNEAFPYMRAGDVAHRPRAGAARCGSPTSASWAGRSTRRPSSAARCGIRCGRPASRSARSPCGGAAYDSLRLEKGYRLWGAGHRRGARPLRGGPRLGGEARARATSSAARRRRDQGARHHPQALLPGRSTTRRSCWSARSRCSTASARSATSPAPTTARRVGESIAYGYLPVEHAEPGTALAVHGAGADHRVTVVSEPRFDPEMARLKDVATAAR